MPFMLNTDGGILTATVPDVCKTQTGPTVTPIPYPNIGNTSMTQPDTLVANVMICASPALNQGSIIATSEGDEPGAQGGVESGVIMQTITFTSGSATVSVGGMPAVRIGDTTSHNNDNTIGIATSSGLQTKVSANG